MEPCTCVLHVNVSCKWCRSCYREQALLQWLYSPHAVHCMVGLPVPSFLDVNSVLGNVLVDVPG